MASRTSTDPIEILLEMGVDLDDLSEQDYLGALMEAVATIEFQTKGRGDARSAVLRKEIIEVRKQRKAADPKFKARKTKISADSFRRGTASPGEVKQNVRTGVIDPSRLKFDSVEVGPKPKALPTSAIVPYQAPQTQEESEKAKAKGKKEEKPKNLLAEIADSVSNIADILKDQYNLKKNEGEFDRKKAQRDRRKLAKENLKKGFGALFKTAENIVKPVRSIFDRIFGFITNILIGKFLMKLVGWFGDPQNRKKINNIIEFLGKHWPKLLSLYLVFGTGLGRFVFSLTKTLITGAVRLTAAIAKLLAAKKLRGAGRIARFLGGRKGRLIGAAGATALTVGGTYAGINALGFSGGGSVEGYSEGGQAQGDRSSTFRFGGIPNLGGIINKLYGRNQVGYEEGGDVDSTIGTVEGPGGTDKVPAMLTAGEFVMSRGAVQRFGVKQLEAMNAAGGGTNQPKVINNKVYAAGGGMVGLPSMGGGGDGMVGFPGLGGGGGGTNALTEQAKVRTLGSILRDPTGIKARRAFFNDPNAYLSDEDFQNRGIFPEDRNRRKRGRGEGGPFLPSLDDVINYGVMGQREVEKRLENLIRQGYELIPRIEEGILGLATGAQEVARQSQITLENLAVGSYRQAEQFAGGLLNAGQQVANDVVNYYESGQMQKDLMGAAESAKNVATGAVGGTFDALISATGSKPYQDFAAGHATVMEDSIKISDSIIDSLPEGSPLQNMMDKGLIPIPTSSPGMMRNMTFVKALLGPLGKPFKIMSNPEVDRMRQLTIDKTLEKSGLIVGKDGEVKMNWNQEDINKGRAGGGAYTDDLGPGGKAFNSILGRFHATTKDGGNILYTDDRYNFNKSTSEYLQKAKDQMLSGAFGEAAYFGAAALGKFAEDIGWLNQRALGSRIAVGEVDRSEIEGAAPKAKPQANVSEAMRQYESGNYDAATKALGGDPTKDEPIPQLTAPSKPKREWYDPRGWVGMQYGGEVNGSLKMGRNAPKISAPGTPMQARVTVIKVPKTGSSGATSPAPRGGSQTPDFNAGNGNPSKRKILGIA